MTEKRALDEAQIKLGLTDDEVKERVAAGKVNGRQDLQTKSVFRIICEHLFTLFNGVNFVLAVLILVMNGGRKWNDVLFMGIVFFNLFVGIFQELRAKKTIEKHDKTRRAYHDYFAKTKWGVASSYDLCVNSTVLGIDGTAGSILPGKTADLVIIDDRVNVDAVYLEGEKAVQNGEICI